MQFFNLLGLSKRLLNVVRLPSERLLCTHQCFSYHNMDSFDADPPIDLNDFVHDPVIGAMLKLNEELENTMQKERERETKLLQEIKDLEFEYEQLTKKHKDAKNLMAEAYMNAKNSLQQVFEVSDNLRAVLEMSNATKMTVKSPPKKGKVQPISQTPQGSPLRNSNVSPLRNSDNSNVRQQQQQQQQQRPTISFGSTTKTNSIVRRRACQIVLEPINMSEVMENDEELAEEEPVISSLAHNSSSDSSRHSLSTIQEETSTFLQSGCSQEPYVCLTRLPVSLFEKQISANMSSHNKTVASASEMSFSVTHYSPDFFSSTPRLSQEMLLKELGLRPSLSVKKSPSTKTVPFITTRRGAIIKRSLKMEAESPNCPSPSTSGTTKCLKVLVPKIENLPTEGGNTTESKKTKKNIKATSNKPKSGLENNSPKSGRPSRKAKPKELKEACLNKKMRRS